MICLLLVSLFRLMNDVIHDTYMIVFHFVAGDTYALRRSGVFRDQQVKQCRSHQTRPRRRRHDGRRYAKIIQAHLLSYARLCHDAARLCHDEVDVERGACERHQRQSLRHHAELVGRRLLSSVKVRLINLPAWTGANGVRGILVSSFGRAHWLVSFARTKIIAGTQSDCFCSPFAGHQQPRRQLHLLTHVSAKKRAAVANLRTRHCWMWRWLQWCSALSRDLHYWATSSCT